MSQLHQIQLQYAPVEDRALLRLRTNDEREFRFWITRRYLQALWPLLHDMMESSGGASVQRSAAARSAVLAFEHEAAVEHSDFDTPYRDDGVTLPLGNAPVLLARAQVKKLDNGNHVLCMHPPHGQGVELAMDGALLHSFVKLVLDAHRTAEWGLPLALKGADDGAAAPPDRVN